MRVKTDSYLQCSQSLPPRSLPVTQSPKSLASYPLSPNSIMSPFDKQRGAGSGLFALFALAVLVSTVAALLLGHKIGYQRGYHAIKVETQKVVSSSEQTAKELKDLQITNKVLTNQVETSKQELAISLANLDELRHDKNQLNVENKQVMQLNELYAKLLSEKGGMPLQVLGAKIEPLPENAFEYGFDVGMLSDDGQAKDLKAILTLQDKDNFIEVPLDPPTYSIQGIVRIRGRFVMPKGFKPLQVKLSLEAGKQEVEQLYDWKLGDMVDNMPLSLLDLGDPDESPIVSKESGSSDKKPSAKTEAKKQD